MQLLKRGSFTLPCSCIEAINEWRKHNDQIQQFIEDCCELSHDSMTCSSDVYKAYKEWASENGVSMVCSHIGLTQRLKNLDVTLRKGPCGVRMLIGIRLVNY